MAGVAIGLAVFLLLPAPELVVPPAPAPDVTVVQAPVAAAPAVVPHDAVPIQATQVPLVPSAPTPDPRVVNEQRLREAIFAPFRSVQGRFGIVARDLATGQSVTLNEHYPFQSASLYKLPVMYSVFKSRDLDIFAFNEEMTIGADDAAMDLGSLPWPIGTRITIGTALERMVTLSDNSGAFMLAKKVTSAKINEDMLSLGLKHTHIRGEDLQTSAYDMARLLEIIARGEALSPESSAEMVHLMARQQVRNRIPVQMPPEATVANKTGNWEDAAHDVAIVYGPRSTFVIALLSDGITDIDGLYDAMATASRNVYDLVNDPEFGSSAKPALPRNLVASYQTPVRLPSGNGAAPSTGQTRPAAPANVAPVQVAPAPVAPRVVAPSVPAVAPAPADAAPQPKPAEKPRDTAADKPAEKPAIKPAAPSIFTLPTPAPKPE